MSRGRSYKLGLTKSSFLTRLALRYVHAIIVLSFAKKGDNTKVVGRHKLLFLFSLVENHPIYLGYTLADFITHQGQHICLGAIFASPYNIQLIRGIGLGDRPQGQETMSSSAPLGMDTLWLMVMVIRHDSRWVLTPSPTEQPPEGGKAKDD